MNGLQYYLASQSISRSSDRRRLSKTDPSKKRLLHRTTRALGGVSGGAREGGACTQATSSVPPLHAGPPPSYSCTAAPTACNMFGLLDPSVVMGTPATMPISGPSIAGAAGQQPDLAAQYVSLYEELTSKNSKTSSLSKPHLLLESDTQRVYFAGQEVKAVVRCLNKFLGKDGQGGKDSFEEIYIELKGEFQSNGMTQSPQSRGSPYQETLTLFRNVVTLHRGSSPSSTSKKPSAGPDRDASFISRNYTSPENGLDYTEWQVTSHLPHFLQWDPNTRKPGAAPLFPGDQPEYTELPTIFKDRLGRNQAGNSIHYTWKLVGVRRLGFQLNWRSWLPLLVVEYAGHLTAEERLARRGLVLEPPSYSADQDGAVDGDAAVDAQQAADDRTPSVTPQEFALASLAPPIPPASSNWLSVHSRTPIGKSAVSSLVGIKPKATVDISFSIQKPENVDVDNAVPFFMHVRLSARNRRDLFGGSDPLAAPSTSSASSANSVRLPTLPLEDIIDKFEPQLVLKRWDLNVNTWPGTPATETLSTKVEWDTDHLKPIGERIKKVRRGRDGRKDAEEKKFAEWADLEAHGWTDAVLVDAAEDAEESGASEGAAACDAPRAKSAEKGKAKETSGGRTGLRRLLFGGSSSKGGSSDLESIRGGEKRSCSHLESDSGSDERAAHPVAEGAALSVARTSTSSSSSALPNNAPPGTIWVRTALLKGTVRAIVPPPIKIPILEVKYKLYLQWFTPTFASSSTEILARKEAVCKMNAGAIAERRQRLLGDDDADADTRLPARGGIGHRHTAPICLWKSSSGVDRDFLEHVTSEEITRLVIGEKRLAYFKSKGLDAAEIDWVASGLEKRTAAGSGAVSAPVADTAAAEAAGVPRTSIARTDTLLSTSSQFSQPIATSELTLQQTSASAQLVDSTTALGGSALHQSPGTAGQSVALLSGDELPTYIDVRRESAGLPMVRRTATQGSSLVPPLPPPASLP